MKKYRLELSRGDVILLVLGLTVFAVCFIVEIFKLIKAFRLGIDFVVAAYIIRMTLDSVMIGMMASYLFRRRVYMYQTSCKLAFGLSTRSIKYADVLGIEKPAIQDSKLHKTWDYGKKEKKWVLIMKNQERVYLSVVENEAFKRDLMQRLDVARQ